MPLSGAPDPGFPDATHKEQACSRTPLTRSRARTNAERTLFRVCQLKGQNVWKVVKVRGPTFAVSSIPFNNTNRTQDNETQGCGAFFQKTLAGTLPVGFSNHLLHIFSTSWRRPEMQKSAIRRLRLNATTASKGPLSQADLTRD